GWGSFYTLYEDNQKNLHKILEDAAAENQAAGSAGQKVADLYTSGMDTLAIEKLGYDPVKPLLEIISNIKDHHELVKLAAAGYAEGYGFLFSHYIGPDDRISTKNVVNFM